MATKADTKPRVVRDTSLNIDRTLPAYLVLYGTFNGPADFARKTGIGVTTCHDWLKRGYVPVRQQAHILACAKLAGLKLDPATFVPAPKLDPSYKIAA